MGREKPKKRHFRVITVTLATTYSSSRSSSELIEKKLFLNENSRVSFSRLHRKCYISLNGFEILLQLKLNTPHRIKPLFKSLSLCNMYKLIIVESNLNAAIYYFSQKERMQKHVFELIKIHWSVHLVIAYVN